MIRISKFKDCTPLATAAMPGGGLMSWSKISRGNFATVVIISLDLTLAVACGTARESETPSEGLTTATQQPANQQSAAQPTVAQLASGGAVPTTVLQPTPAGDGTMAAAPMGTLNTGLKETGRFFLHRSTFPSVLEVEGAQQLMVPNAVETGLRISDFQLPNHRLPNHRRRSAGGDQH